MSKKHHWLTLLLPSFIVLSMLLAIEWLNQASLIFRAQLQVVPYFSSLMTIVLATQFHQYRFVFLSIALSLSYLVFSQLFNSDAVISLVGLYWGMAFVTSAAFIYLLMMPERFPWQLSGLLRIAVLALPFFLLLEPAVTSWLKGYISLLPGGLIEALGARIWVPPITAGLFIFVWLLSLYYWWRRRDPASGVAPPVIAACFAAMTWLSQPVVGLALFIGASFALLSNIFLQAWYFAYRDELTGIPSRRAYQQYTHRLRGRYTMAMIDIDHFKSFNDTYGHDIGDDVLRVVATRLHGVKRGGKAFRLGGEEFVIVFANKQIEQVLGELERLRKAIANHPIVLRDLDSRPKSDGKGRRKRAGAGDQRRQVRITVSMGAAEPNRINRQPQAVLRLADQMLYRAKDQGRNQIVH